jgi:hypothetical protein
MGFTFTAQRPEDLPASPEFTAWIGAAQALASQRVVEHQTVTIEDFFDAVREGTDLRGYPALENIQSLLKRAKRVGPPLKTVFEVATDGFKSTLDGIRSTQEKIDAVALNVDVVGVKVRGAIGGAVASVHMELKDFRAEMGESRSALAELQRMLPPVLAIQRIALGLAIAGAVALGGLGGLLARSQFGAF